MLLVRSSSTPVLGSLVSSLHPCETLKEADREGEAAQGLSRSSSCSFSFLGSSGIGSALLGASGGGDEACASLEGASSADWDFDTRAVPWPRFRRVQSESDLQSMGGAAGAGYGKSPARLAADSLLMQADGGDAAGSGAQRQWSRRMALRRTGSATPDPGAAGDKESGGGPAGGAVEMVCSGGIAITMSSKSIYDLKEEDTPASSYARSSCLSGTDEDEESVRRGAGLAAAGVTTGESATAAAAAAAAHLAASAYDPTRAPDRGPALFHGEHLRFGAGGLDESEEDDDDDEYAHHHLGGPLHFRASAAGTDAPPSVSGRPDAVYKVNDEVYTSTAVSSDGSLLFCNAKGCRPLSDGEKAEAMFIAGGLGIGGGGPGGGRGGGPWVGVSGGGGSSGWGGFGTETEAYYKRMLQVHPGNALLLRNYAKFLYEVGASAAI